VAGFSFTELLVICLVALVAVGPKRLPSLLHTLGTWIRRARNMVSDMRAQSGIDEMLKAEGLHGGIQELRGLVRGAQVHWPPIQDPITPAPQPGSSTSPVEASASAANNPHGAADRYNSAEIDATKEYPPEGCDAYAALPDDLLPAPEAPAFAADVAPQNIAPEPPLAAVATPSELTPANGADALAHEEASQGAHPASEDVAPGPQTSETAPATLDAPTS